MEKMFLMLTNGIIIKSDYVHIQDAKGMVALTDCIVYKNISDLLTPFIKGVIATELPTMQVRIEYIIAQF